MMNSFSIKDQHFLLTFISVLEVHFSMSDNRVEGDGSPYLRALQERSLRHSAFSVIEVRKFKRLPFFCYSAVLLDISSTGCKIEFAGEHRIKVDEERWLYLPLAPLGFVQPNALCIKASCRWFIGDRYRSGWVFEEPSESMAALVERVIVAVDEISSRKS